MGNQRRERIRTIIAILHRYARRAVCLSRETHIMGVLFRLPATLVHGFVKERVAYSRSRMMR
jgi:hypothetical protein